MRLSAFPFALKLISTILFFVFVTRLFTRQFGHLLGLHICLLIWNLVILFTPLPKGRVLFDAAFLFFIERVPWYSELVLWLAALVSTLLSYVIVPENFFHHSLPHLLAYLLTHPSPYWLIIAACALPMFLRLLYVWRFGAVMPWNRKIPIAMSSLFAALVAYVLAYKELIIMINSYRLGP